MMLVGGGTRSFDRLTRLAAGLLSAPVALLTFVEVDPQFFLSSYGLPEPIRSARQTALEYSIRQYVVASGRPLILNDTSQDPRLRGHLAVTELGVTSYAGMPLRAAHGYAGAPLPAASGYAGGALAVLDFVPRDWTGDMLATLANLANVASEELGRFGWLATGEPEPGRRSRVPGSG